MAVRWLIMLGGQSLPLVNNNRSLSDSCGSKHFFVSHCWTLLYWYMVDFILTYDLLLINIFFTKSASLDFYSEKRKAVRNFVVLPSQTENNLVSVNWCLFFGFWLLKPYNIGFIEWVLDQAVWIHIPFCLLLIG